MDAHESPVDGPSVVLAAIDGTDPSMRAAAYAIGLARRSGSRLLGVFVRGADATPSALATAALLECEAETAEGIKRAAAERARTLGVPITVLEREGEPCREILRAAREHRADLIVVGASEGLAHRVAGSLGVRLARARKYPVLVVP